MQTLYANSPLQPRDGSTVGKPHPKSGDRRARRSPAGSRAPARLGIPARRPPPLALRELPGEGGTRRAPGNLTPTGAPGSSTYLPHPGGARAGVSAAGRPRPPARANKDAPERERALPFPAALADGGQPCPVAVRASRGWAARGPGQSRGPRPGSLLQPCALAPARIPTLSPGATHANGRAFTSSRVSSPFFPSRPLRDLSWSKESKGESESPSP